MTASIPLIIAVVLLVLSFAWAAYKQEMSALLLAVWSVAALYIFGALGLR